MKNLIYSSYSSSLFIPKQIWFEKNECHSCDVLVEMEEGTVYTALFVTMDYLQRQMDLNFALTQQIPDTPAVHYLAIDTPHIMIKSIDKEYIEDVIDNFIALDVFGCHFTRVTDSEDDLENIERTSSEGKRATQEVAAVVIADVLKAQA
ncbi:hypothetical protein MASR2M15_29260 [Anaerolineales bacterium]